QRPSRSMCTSSESRCSRSSGVKPAVPGGGRKSSIRGLSPSRQARSKSASSRSERDEPLANGSRRGPGEGMDGPLADRSALVAPDFQLFANGIQAAFHRADTAIDSYGDLLEVVALEA